MKCPVQPDAREAYLTRERFSGALLAGFTGKKLLSRADWVSCSGFPVAGWCDHARYVTTRSDMLRQQKTPANPWKHRSFEVPRDGVTRMHTV